MKTPPTLLLAYVFIVTFFLCFAFWPESQVPQKSPSVVTLRQVLPLVSEPAQPPTVTFLQPVVVTPPVPLVPHSIIVPRSESLTTTPSATAPAQSFIRRPSSERRKILDGILKQDFPSIMQNWLDAGRVEHDLSKQVAIEGQFAGVVRVREPNPAFLQQVKDFITDKSNSDYERHAMLAVLGEAATVETENILIEIVTTATDDVTRSAAAGLAGLGTGWSGNQENLAPALEKLWKGDTRDEITLAETAMGMAQVGASSSLELLLTAALLPKGRDDLHKNAALYALNSAHLLNDHSVPPLAARLSRDAPDSEASIFARDILDRMTIVSAV